MAKQAPKRNTKKNLHKVAENLVGNAVAALNAGKPEDQHISFDEALAVGLSVLRSKLPEMTEEVVAKLS